MSSAGHDLRTAAFAAPCAAVVQSKSYPDYLPLLRQPPVDCCVIRHNGRATLPLAWGHAVGGDGLPIGSRRNCSRADKRQQQEQERRAPQAPFHRKLRASK